MDLRHFAFSLLLAISCGCCRDAAMVSTDAPLTTEYLPATRILWTAGAPEGSGKLLKAFCGQVAVNEPEVCTLHSGDAVLLDFGRELHGGLRITGAIWDSKATPRVRIPAPPDYTVQKYTDEVFWMFTGPERVVTLRCCNYLIDQVIDKFGPDIKIRNPRKETFDVSVPVQVSGTFLAWVFQFAGEMAIIAPDDVKDLYASRLQDALDDALS